MQQIWSHRLNSGDQAYELVRAYSKLVIHHKGTQWDCNTSNWLGSELTIFGANVAFQTFLHYHFEPELSVQSAGKSIHGDALYYSFAGQHDVTNLSFGLIDAHADEAMNSSDIYCMIATA